MLTVYILCLLLGGTMLGLAMFGGDFDSDTGDFDAGGDLDTDGHFDSLDAAGADFDASAGELDIGAQTELSEVHSGGLDVHSGAGGHTAIEAVQFFSFRNLIFFTAFFGLTGTALTLAGSGFWFTLFASAGLGSLTALFGYHVMRYLKRTESGKVLDYGELIGRSAQVILAFDESVKGKISLKFQGQTVRLLALATEGSEHTDFSVGDTVVILRVAGGVAYCMHADYI